ncbi:MAG: flagellar basal-body MS-ring/collar protein FliF [Terriglobales bacterium]
MKQGLDQIQDFLRGLSLQQKALIAGGAIAVGLILWLFVTLLDPKNVVLYSGLKPQDAQSMGSRLAAKNIPYEISPDGGSLLVPSDKLDAARLETAAQGLPRNARLGFELFDTPNWAGSDFSEKVNYQRALEGELERTLQTLSEIEAVRVHLVLPRESLFSEQERESKAAVIVKTHGGTLSREAQQAIPQLVASAVDGLRPENVTVVDADTAMSFLARRGPSGRAFFDSDEELAAAAVHAIEPVVGAEHVRASVHVDYDLSSSEDTSEIYDPKATATLAQQHSEELAGGANPAGVPGVTSNVPGSAAAVAPPIVTPPVVPPAVSTPTVPGAAKNVVAGIPSSIPSNAGAIPSMISSLDNQSSKSDSSTYAVSKDIRHVLNPAGRVRRITASILIDDAIDTKPENGKPSTATTRRKRTPEEMTAIEKLARAAIGIDDQRGDLLAVENLSFQTVPIESPAVPGKLDQWRLLVLPWAGALRYVGITLLFLIVYALVLRPVKKQAIAAFKQIPSHFAKPLAAGAGAPNAVGGLELPPGSEEAKRAGALKKELSDKIKAEPAAASRLVQGWIHEPKAK